MNYTCAVFDESRRDQSLEAGAAQQAQDPARDFAQGRRPTSSVLDIGCGWGANLEYLATARGVKRRHRRHALDARRHDEINAAQDPGRRRACARLQNYEPEREVRRAHLDLHDRPPLLARGGARRARRVDIYRDVLPDVLRELDQPGRVVRLPDDPPQPRRRGSHEGPPATIGLAAPHEIFPGGLNPRLEEIIQAVNPYWEVVEVQHAPRALPAHGRAWLRAPARSREDDPQQVGRRRSSTTTTATSSTCVRAFDKHYSRSRSTSSAGSTV